MKKNLILLSLFCLMKNAHATEATNRTNHPAFTYFDNQRESFIKWANNLTADDLRNPEIQEKIWSEEKRLGLHVNPLEKALMKYKNMTQEQTASSNTTSPSWFQAKKATLYPHLAHYKWHYVGGAVALIACYCIYKWVKAKKSKQPKQ